MGRDLGAAVSQRGLSLRETADIVAAAIQVLRVRDGVQITDDQALERANNIVQILDGLGALRVRT